MIQCYNTLTNFEENIKQGSTAFHEDTNAIVSPFLVTSIFCPALFSSELNGFYFDLQKRTLTRMRR